MAKWKVVELAEELADYDDDADVVIFDDVSKKEYGIAIDSVDGKVFLIVSEQ